MSEQSIPLPKETSAAERWGYAAYFGGQNLVYILIQAYLVVYYVSYLKLSPALIAAIFLVVRIWDAVNDPIIGVIMDRMTFLNSRHKGWINMSTFTMPLATFILFLAPAQAAFGVKVAYIVITYLLWDVLYTISEVPIFSISTSMTRSERERTLLLTLSQVGSVLGTAAGMGVVALLLGNGVDQVNWTLMGGIPSLLTLALMLPQIFFVKERYNTEAVEEVSLREILREVLRNDQHLIMMSFFISQMFLNAVAVFSVYVAEGYYGDARLASITSVFSLLGIVGLGFFTTRIVQRYGKRKFLEVSMLSALVLSIPLFFIPGNMPLLAMLFFGLRTAALIVTTLLRPMFTADNIEYGEYKTGVRSDSTSFAIQTFFNKTGDALGTSLGGIVLALTMFNENLPLTGQNPGTIQSMQVWFVILPMAMAAVMYLGPKLFYKLDEEKVKAMIVENEKRRTA